MGQFAVGPVDIAPLLEQRQDLGCLIGQHPMHRGPTRGPVSQPATGPPGVPPVGTDLPDFQCPAGPADRPAGIEGVVDQIEQSRFRGRIHPAWDPAT